MALHGERHQDHQHTGLLTRIAHDVVAAYDWVSGPGMTERDRLQREVFEFQGVKHLNVSV